MGKTNDKKAEKGKTNDEKAEKAGADRGQERLQPLERKKGDPHQDEKDKNSKAKAKAALITVDVKNSDFARKDRKKMQREEEQEENADDAEKKKNAMSKDLSLREEKQQHHHPVDEKKKSYRQGGEEGAADDRGDELKRPTTNAAAVATTTRSIINDDFLGAIREGEEDEDDDDDDDQDIDIEEQALDFEQPTPNEEPATAADAVAAVAAATAAAAPVHIGAIRIRGPDYQEGMGEDLLDDDVTATAANQWTASNGSNSEAAAHTQPHSSDGAASSGPQSTAVTTSSGSSSSPHLPVATAVGNDEHEEEELLRRETLAQLKESLPQPEGDWDVEERRRRRNGIVIILLVVAALVIIVVAVGVALGRRNKDDDDQRSIVSATMTTCQGAGSILLGTAVAASFSTLVDTSSSHPIKTPVPACETASESLVEGGIWYKFMGTGTTVKAFTCNKDAAASPSSNMVDTQISVFQGSCGDNDDADSSSSLQCVTGNDNFCGLQSVASWFAEQDVEYYIVVTPGREDDDAGSNGGSFVLTMEPGQDNDACDTAQGPLEMNALLAEDNGSLFLATPASRETTTTSSISNSNNAPHLPVCGSAKSGAWFTVNGTGKGLRVTLCHHVAAAAATMDEENNIFAATTAAVNVAVFEGNECSELTCAVGGADAMISPTGKDSAVCGGDADVKATTLSWRSELGKVYHVLVDYQQPPVQDNNNGVADSSSQAPFSLVMADFEITHDVCEEAKLLGPNQTLIGTVENATRAIAAGRGRLPSCGGSNSKERDLTDDHVGLWYRLVGSGTYTRVSVCDAATDGMELFVFEKSCNDLTCVDASIISQSACETEWISDQGTAYYLFVARANTAKGVDFQIEVSNYEQIAPNDECKNAIELVPDGSAVVGSTLQAIRNDAIIAGSEATTIQAKANCILYAEYSTLPWTPAVWYYVKGTGNEMVVSTCDSRTLYDTVILVSKGTCSNIICMETDDPSIICDESPASSTAVFDTVEGENYYIMVVGPFLNNILSLPPVGDFAITVREKVGIANDDCRNAEYVLPQAGRTVLGTTVNAQADKEIGCSALCQGGVWFETRGTGSILRVLLLFLQTDFSGVVNVYEGSCDELIPVGSYVKPKNLLTTASQIPSFIIEAGGAVEWPSEPGKVYYIHVFGLNDQGNFGFELAEVKETSDISENGCQDAGTLVPGIPTLGSGDDLAKNTNGIPGCTATESFGAWYRLEISTEEAVLVSTCSPSTRSNAGVKIYAGDGCDSLCEPTSVIELGCEDGLLGMRVVWNADPLTQYYVQVQAGVADGAFELNSFVVPGIAPLNDKCHKATELTPTGELVTGDTFLGDFDLPFAVFAGRPTCGLNAVSPAPGLWYKVLGTGTQLRISACTDATVMGTLVSVYGGSCEGGSATLRCIGASLADPASCDSSSSVSWPSVAGEEYHIYVQGSYLLETIQFGIYLEEVGGGSVDQQLYQLPPPPATRQVIIDDNENDDCANAFEILPSSGTYRGTTANAGIDTVPPCPYVVAPDSPGVWFKAVGTGKGFRISTCHAETHFDTYFRVFESPQGTCEDLRCLRAVNAFPLFTPDKGCSLVTGGFYTRTSFIRTKPGYTYFVLLEGFSAGKSGEYEISLEEVDLAANDLIGEAERLEFGERAFVSGSTVIATPDEETLVCEDYQNPRNLRLDMPGVFYELVADDEDGNGFIASTCNNSTDFDTKISVYTGDDVSRLRCVGFNDDATGCGTKSALSWRGRPGERFYLEVHGYWATRPTGNFGLSIEKFTVADNDECGDALILEPSVGEVTIGSTSNALADGTAPFCYLPVGSPSVWYQVMGTGKSIRASTCTPETTFDTRLIVYEGGDCTNLACINANSDSGVPCEHSDDASTVQWHADVGKTYYLLVYGAPGESGDFGLTVEEVDAPQTDLCVNALVANSSPFSETRSTVNASQDMFVPSCNGEKQRAPGVWYTAKGTGGRMRASTCGGTSMFSAQVSVYAGLCERPDCVESEADVFSPCTKSWLTSSSLDYQLLVHGTNASETGEFTFSMERVEPPSNHKCRTAELIDPETEVEVVGSSWASTIDEDVLPCNGDGEHKRGLWYTIGENSFRERADVVATTCSSETDFDARISIYSGNTSCESLTCVDTLEDTSTCGEARSLLWTAEPGETYYIFVHGSTSNQVGRFGLTVKEIQTPENSDCERAPDISIGDIVKGSTQFADIDDDLPNCGVAVVSASVWYAVTLNSTSTVTAKIRGLGPVTKFSTTVFSGNKCGELTCVLSDEFAYSTSWAALKGVTYYLLVRAREEGDVGSFQLEFLAEDGNDDFCPGASELVVGGEVLQSSTDFAATSDDTPFCGAAVDGPSKWHRVVGTGTRLQVSTCHDATEFDTEIAVYSGSCEALSCVASDNDRCRSISGASVVAWDSDAGEEYFVVVHGFRGAKGDYGITVEEVGVV